VATSGRIAWIDNARAAGIVLIVLGHAPALPEGVREFLYRFHIPLFFFLAGAVVKPARFAAGFGRWTARQARLLLVPYVFFWALSTAWWFTIRNLGEKAAETGHLAWWRPAHGLLVGTGEALFVNPPLWFFPSLFVTATAAWGVWWLTRWGSIRLRLAVAAVGMVVLVLPFLGLPALWWNLDLLPWTLFFYLLGAARGRLIEVLAGRRRPLAQWAAPLVFLLVAWKVRKWSPFDLNAREFGRWPWLAFGSATVLVVAFSTALGLAGSRPWLVPLSRNTIVIFPLHGLCFSVFTGLLSLSPVTASWGRTGGWPAAVAFTAGAIIACLVVSPWLHRWAPWTLGHRLQRPPEETLAARTPPS
jgi:acyltransferase